MSLNDENYAPEVNGPRESNLMLLTKSRRADIAELKETLGSVKPEQDPFWEARGKQRTEKLVHNSVTESIKARARSRLYESTTAHKASTRVKAFDEKEYTYKKEIPEASSNSTFLMPTAAFRHKKDAEPETSESADILTEKKLHEFGNTIHSFNRNPIQGTAGFGLACKEAPSASSHQPLEKKLTQPQVSERLLLSTTASKLNKFHDDARAAQKTAELAAEETARLRRVKNVSNESEFLRPTTAYIQHHSGAPEPDSAYEGVVHKNLTEFGHVGVSYNTKTGTAGFGLGSKPANQEKEDSRQHHFASSEVSDRLLLCTHASKLQGYAAFREHKQKQMTRTPGKTRRRANIASAVYTQKTAAMMATKKRQSPPQQQQRRRYSFAPKMYSWGDNPVPKSLKAERRESMPAPGPAPGPAPASSATAKIKTQRWAVHVDGAAKAKAASAAAASPMTESKSTPRAAHSRATPEPAEPAHSTTAPAPAASEETPNKRPGESAQARASSAKKATKRTTPSPGTKRTQPSPSPSTSTSTSTSASPSHPQSPTRVYSSKSASKSGSDSKRARRRSSGVFGTIFAKSPALRVPTPKTLTGARGSGTPGSADSTSTASVHQSSFSASASASAQATPELQEQEQVELSPLGADLAMEAEVEAEPQEHSQAAPKDKDGSLEAELEAWEKAHLDEPEAEAEAEAEAEEPLFESVVAPAPAPETTTTTTTTTERAKRSSRRSSSGGDSLAGLLNSNMALEILEAEAEKSRMGMNLSRTEERRERREQDQVEAEEEEEEVHFQPETVATRATRARPSPSSKGTRGTPRTAGKGSSARAVSSPSTPPTISAFSSASSSSVSMSMLAGSGGSGKKKKSAKGKRSAVKPAQAAAKKLSPVREVYQPNQTVHSHHGIDLDNITQEIAHLLVDSPLVPAYQKAAADVSTLTPPSPTDTQLFRSNLRASAADAALDLSRDYSSSSTAPTQTQSQTQEKNAADTKLRTPPSASASGSAGRRRSMVPDLDLSPLSPLQNQTRSSARLAAIMLQATAESTGTPSSASKRGTADTPKSSTKKKTRKSPRSSAKKGASK